MTDNCYVDSIPNDILTNQQANTGETPVDVNAKPQQAFVTANDLIQNPADARGDLSHAPRLDRQAIDVQASGDMAAGEYSGGQERTPRIKGLLGAHTVRALQVR
ncbi:MAG TPA: hypothetical protein VIV83_07510 [Gemmatimonadales bacterium]|jgi:hypothetical protein